MVIVQQDHWHNQTTRRNLEFSNNCYESESGVRMVAGQLIMGVKEPFFSKRWGLPTILLSPPPSFPRTPVSSRPISHLRSQSHWTNIRVCTYSTSSHEFPSAMYRIPIGKPTTCHCQRMCLAYLLHRLPPHLRFER